MMRRYKAVMSSVSCLLRQNARQWQNRVPSTPLTNNQLLGSTATFKLHDTYRQSCLFCTQKDGKSTEPPGDELVYEEFYDEDDLESVLPEPDVSISMKRGKEGVYDLQELVTLLRSEQIQDLCAIYVPPEKNYSDYLVIGTGLSVRHIQGIANYVKRIYKAKRSGRDPKTVTIEGHRKAKDWLAMDMGNIVLHLMLPKVRKLYDIESLWTCGPEFDSQIDEETDDIYSLELLDLDLKDFDFGENLRTYQKKNENNATLER